LQAPRDPPYALQTWCLDASLLARYAPCVSLTVPRLSRQRSRCTVPLRRRVANLPHLRDMVRRHAARGSSGCVTRVANSAPVCGFLCRMLWVLPRLAWRHARGDLGWQTIEWIASLLVLLMLSGITHLRHYDASRCQGWTLLRVADGRTGLRLCFSLCLSPYPLRAAYAAGCVLL